MASLITRTLNRITKDPREQKNVKHLGLNTLLTSADLPLYTGTELQAFLVRIGLRTGQMGTADGLVALTSISVMLLSTGFVDRIRDRVNALALVIAGMALWPLTLVTIALGPQWLRDPQTAFHVYIPMGMVNATFSALNSVLYTTLFARCISPNIRGRFSGAVGVIGGIIGIVMGLVSALALRIYGFPYGFVLAFGLGAVLIVASSLVLRGTKELPELQGEEVSRQLPPIQNIKKIVKMRQFKILMPANILRGLGDGAGAFAMAVGMKRIGLSFEYAGYTTSLVYLAGILGTALIGFTVDRFGAGKVIPRAEILLSVGLMGMVLVSHPIAFLAFFLLWQVMLVMEGNAVPLLHYEVVPVEVIGTFSSLRLVILTLGIGLSRFTMGRLLDTVNPIFVYALCVCIKLSAGALYWYAARVLKAAQKPATVSEE